MEHTALSEFDTVGLLEEESLSRDLRITGVTKNGTIWFYHVEVLCSPISNGVTYAVAQSQSSKNKRESDDCNGKWVNLPLVRYSVQRRFSEFRRLYLKLLSTDNKELLEQLPAFPDAGWLSFLRSNDRELLQERQTKLQAFIRALDACAQTKWWKSFVRFLTPDVAQLELDDHQWSCLGKKSKLHGRIDQPNSSWSHKTNVKAEPPRSAPGALETHAYVSLSRVASPQLHFCRRSAHSAPSSTSASGGHLAASTWGAATPGLLSSRSLVELTVGNLKKRFHRTHLVEKPPMPPRDLDGGLGESSLYKILHRLVVLGTPSGRC